MKFLLTDVKDGILIGTACNHISFGTKFHTISNSVIYDEIDLVLLRTHLYGQEYFYCPNGCHAGFVVQGDIQIVKDFLAKYKDVYILGEL